MKKAQSTVLRIFELLLVVMVALGLIGIAQSYASSERAEKIAAAEELRLMVNTLIATTGDAQVEYPKDVSNYNFRMSRGEISVFSDGEPQEAWISRVFSLPEGYKASGLAEKEGDICLQKKANNIFLKPC